MSNTGAHVMQYGPLKWWHTNLNWVLHRDLWLSTSLSLFTTTKLKAVSKHYHKGNLDCLKCAFTGNPIQSQNNITFQAPDYYKKISPSSKVCPIPTLISTAHNSTKLEILNSIKKEHFSQENWIKIFETCRHSMYDFRTPIFISSFNIQTRKSRVCSLWHVPCLRLCNSAYERRRLGRLPGDTTLLCLALSRKARQARPHTYSSLYSVWQHKLTPLFGSFRWRYLFLCYVMTYRKKKYPRCKV